MANKYIAVTIGPIFDTINLASSPSALWAASYLFSMLSKNICQTLTENGINKEEIISPYYDPDDELLNKNDGVGLFHDRIIFRSENFFSSRAGTLIISKSIFLFRLSLLNPMIQSLTAPRLLIAWSLQNRLLRSVEAIRF